MNKVALLAHFKKALDGMLDESWLLRTFLQNPYSRDNIYLRNGWLIFGATRATLLTDDCDYVVKFNLDADTDDCRREMKLYAEARKVGVAAYFVPVEYLGCYTVTYNWVTWEEFEDIVDKDEDAFRKVARQRLPELEPYPITISIPLYAYRIAECDCDLRGAATPEEAQFLRRHPGPLTDATELVGLNFLRDHGADAYLALTAFCNEWGINDLHKGNVGYIDKKLVITDYAGYTTSTTFALS